MVRLQRAITAGLVLAATFALFLITGLRERPVTITKDRTERTISGKAVGDDTENTWHQSYNDGMVMEQQVLYGMVFNKQTKMGSVDGEFGFNVTLSLVKSLSPPVLNHVSKMFSDDYNENLYYATVPAMIKRGRVVQVVQRIWLGQYEQMKTSYRAQGKELINMFYEWKNSWQENYLYHMVLDENYNMIQPGELLGVPTTTNVKFTYKSDGAMDPRLVQVGHDVFLVFHTWLVDKNSNDDVGGRVHIWDMDRRVKTKLRIGMKLQRTEINWTPLDRRGQLYLTYSIDPLRVMTCDTSDGNCHFVYEQDGSNQHKFLYTNDHLRGGTPWVEYKYPYYISIAHNVAATYKPSQDFAIYNANLVMINVEDWRIVFVSRNIKANRHWLVSEPIIRNHTIATPFWYPTGIILQTDDVIDISCHLNDASGHILRLKGVKSLLTEAIRRDEASTSPGSPTIRTVQQYVLESVKREYKGVWTFFGDIIGHTVEGVDINP